MQIARVEEALDLTKSQKEKIQEAMDDMQAEMREAFGGGRGGRGGQGGQGGQGGGRGNFEEMREKMQEMNKQLEEDIMDVLSSKQRDMLEKDLKGKEFDVTQLQRGRGGRGGAEAGGAVVVAVAEAETVVKPSIEVARHRRSLESISIPVQERAIQCGSPFFCRLSS